MSDEAPKRRRWSKKQSVAIATGLVVAALAWTSRERMNQWPCRRALPANAEDVHELIWENFPDYRYQLKAKLSEEQFRQYIVKFDLTAHSSLRQYSDDAGVWLRWQPKRKVDWWDPSESLDETFVRQIGDTWTFAKRERGYLYLMSLNH